MLSFIDNPTKQNTRSNSAYASASLLDVTFPVEQKELFYYDKNTLAIPSGTKALLRADNQEVLYVGSQYSPVLNSEILDSLEVLEESGWQAHEVRAFNSRVFSFAYVHPDIRFTVSGLSTTAKIVVFNSYDGSHALKVFIGGIIGVCSNGLVIGKGIEYKRKHTGNILDFREILIETTQKRIHQVTKEAESKVWETEDVDKLEKIWKTLTKPYPNSTNGQPNKIVYALNQRFQVEQSLGYKGEQAMMMAATHIATHEASSYSGTYIMQLEKDIPKVFFNN